MLQQIESYFTDYEKQLFGGGLPINYAIWEREVWDYFDKFSDYPDKIDALFNRFAQTWGKIFLTHQFAAADAVWELPIGFAHGWEQNRGKRLHKGTPYYFRGMSAIVNGNIDRGFLFMHQALEEDEQTWGPESISPARSFVTLDYNNRYQAALQIVKSKADWVAQ